MPDVVDRRTLLQFPQKKSSLVSVGLELGGILANRKAAMERVFAATHGRPMTEAERRRFKETGD